MTCPKQATREREEVPLANVPSPAPRSRRNSDHFELANKTAAGLGQLVSRSGSQRTSRTSEDDVLGPTACTPAQPSPDKRLDAELLGVAYLLNGNTTPVSSVAAAQALHASVDPHLANAGTGAEHACSPRASARWSFPHEGGDAQRLSDGHRASNESIAAVLTPIAGTRGHSNSNNASGDVGRSRAGGEKQDEPPQLFRTGWSHGGEKDSFNMRRHPKGRRSKSTLGFAVASSSVTCERKIADEIMRECRWQSSASISPLAHSRPGYGDRSSQSASPVAALQSPPPHGNGLPRVNGRLTETDTKALPEPGASQLITTQTQTLGGRQALRGRQNSTMALADIFWYSQSSVFVSRQCLLIL
jgi:hypothetical protein